MKAIYHFSSSIKAHKEKMRCYYVDFIADIYLNLTFMVITHIKVFHNC